jgi:hypothetical protein
MPKAKPIVVTVTDESLKDIKSVANQLAAKGMKVNQVLEITGVISGSCSEEKKPTLRTVRGVHSVEDDMEVQLSPTDSNIQ